MQDVHGGYAAMNPGADFVQHLDYVKKMDLNQKVQLISFNGELSTPDDCDSSENYWSLIGKSKRNSIILSSGEELLIHRKCPLLLDQFIIN